MHTCISISLSLSIHTYVYRYIYIYIYTHTPTSGAYVAIRQQEVLQGTQEGSKPSTAATDKGLKKILRRS